MSNEVKKLDLPKIIDPRGNLSFIESDVHVPFKIRRTYWIYDVPGGCVRGGHGYRDNEEFVVALSGSFDVVIHDGVVERRYHLNRSYNGIFIPKMMWRSLDNFSTNSVAMILSSTDYSANDYIKDFDQFLKEKKNE